MKVSEVIELLQGLSNQEEELLAPFLFSLHDYLYEFEDYAKQKYNMDLPAEIKSYVKEHWSELAQGVHNDDRVHEAFTASTNFDFSRILDDYEKTQVKVEEEEQLWKE